MPTNHDRAFGWILVSLIFFIAILHAFMFTLGWQRYVPWIDAPMHVLGGAWVGATGMWFFRRRDGRFLLSLLEAETPRLAITLLLITIPIGIGWEVFEAGIQYLANGFLSTDVPDTIADTLCNATGAILAAIGIRAWAETRTQ